MGITSPAEHSGTFSEPPAPPHQAQASAPDRHRSRASLPDGGLGPEVRGSRVCGRGQRGRGPSQIGRMSRDEKYAKTG